MSTLTSLISAGGGGGNQTHIVTDPRQLNRLGVGSVLSIITNNALQTTASRLSSTSNFWDSGNTNGLGNSGFVSVVDVTAADTYATLLDASNANGGYLYWVLGCTRANTFGDTSTIKITVDGGTPFEITYGFSSNAVVFIEGRPFLGSGVSSSVNNGITSGTITNANDFWNSTSYGMGSFSTPSLEEPANGFFSDNRRQQRIIADFGVLDNANFQKLYFTTSLKIEVKQSVYSITNNNQKAACLYKLL